MDVSSQLQSGCLNAVHKEVSAKRQHADVSPVGR